MISRSLSPLFDAIQPSAVGVTPLWLMARTEGAVGPLLEALTRLGESIAQLAAVLSGLVWPWFPVVLWGAFWLLLVDWRTLLNLLHRGGWGIVLLLAAGVYVAVSLLAGSHVGVADVPRESWLFAWRLSPNVQRLVDAAVLVATAMIAGAIQLGPWWSDSWGRRTRRWTAEDSTGDDVVSLPLGSLGRLEGPAFGADSQGIS